MKTMMIYLFLVCIVATGQAQDVIELEEANVNLTPKAVMVKSDLDGNAFMVKESYAGQFSKDPIQFMLDNFNSEDYMVGLRDKDYDKFIVTFKSGKGYLAAHFDKKNGLEKTYQKFRNVSLPLAISREIYTKYPGWTITKNTHIASGKKAQLDKDIYKLTLESNNKTQKVKINNIPTVSSRVASN
ncbi:hypothetical protein L1I30_08315 [Gillisia sp. M10.2A]|uniref:Nicotinate-nucleotide adenylyltransferase n=1 Tax=Gillisia lutea TaxID=2909668 RepID=A0ABS9EFK8_9FLAO|nr:hypothetical protein [Gillisia lutea]MCF4101665.1 hypothetical protein [Gillisia lutea]